jgi:ribonuclease HI
MAELVIYTDGSSRGNPGPGGYGAILQWGHVRKEIAQGYRKTTNNRMELMAVIAAIEMLTRENVSVTVYSDSSYVVNAIEKGWLFGWIKIGFKGKKNADLWTRFYGLYKKHKIKFVWVKGHADNPMNNRCDELATGAADSGNLLVDTGYEQNGGLL